MVPTWSIPQRSLQHIQLLIFFLFFNWVNANPDCMCCPQPPPQFPLIQILMANNTVAFLLLTQYRSGLSRWFHIEDGNDISDCSSHSFCLNLSIRQENELIFWSFLSTQVSPSIPPPPQISIYPNAIGKQPNSSCLFHGRRAWELIIHPFKIYARHFCCFYALPQYRSGSRSEAKNFLFAFSILIAKDCNFSSEATKNLHFPPFFW